MDGGVHNFHSLFIHGASVGGMDGDFFETPNCPRDLIRMEPDESARWRCPACGLVQLL